MVLFFDLQEVISAFIIIFAMVDPIGLIPVALDIQRKTGPIAAGRATIVSATLLLAFLFAGTAILDIFGVDIQSFAVAGATILLMMALEMLTDREIFRYSATTSKTSTAIVPIAFPLIAGAGTFTSLISLRVDYNILNLVIALLAVLAIVYVVLLNLKRMERLLGSGGILVARKFFGVILLAIGVKMFSSNIAALIH